MKDELKKYTYWARWDGGNRWTLGLSTPIAPTLLLWLTQTYQIERLQPLPSGTAAVLLHATPKTNAVLMELPTPKGRGSRHESNLIYW